MRALALAVFVAGCSGASRLEDQPCPPAGTKLTYENFGRRFFDVNCVSCHGGASGYSSRSFTTVESIRAAKDRIYINAAAANTSMPPGPDDPSQEDRDKLAEWLACGAPSSP